jgi:hypothetical protein
LAFGGALGRILRDDAGGRETEEGNHAPAPGGRERSRLPRPLVDECLPDHVVVERDDATVETGDGVCGVECEGAE